MGFTCTASSINSKAQACNKIFETNDNSRRKRNDDYGWVTKGNGVGSWLKISFHANILVSKIVYRHNRRMQPLNCCNQNFKDVSLGFSDGSYVNISLDNIFQEDFHYRIRPPKLSTYVFLYINSVYNEHTPERGFEYTKDRYGLSKLRVYGSVTPGKSTINFI